VCGSTKHPYSLYPQLDHEANDQLRSLRHAIEGLKKKMYTTRSQIESLPTLFSDDSGKDSKLQPDLETRLKNIETELAHCINSANLDWPGTFRDDVWSAWKRSIQNEVDSYAALNTQAQSISRGWLAKSQQALQIRALLNERQSNLAKAVQQAALNDKQYQEAVAQFDTYRQRFDTMLKPTGLQFGLDGTFKTDFENLGMNIQARKDLKLKIDSKRKTLQETANRITKLETTAHLVEAQRAKHQAEGQAVASAINIHKQELDALFNNQHWQSVRNTLQAECDSASQLVEICNSNLQQAQKNQVEITTRQTTLQKQLTDLKVLLAERRERFLNEAQLRGFADTDVCTPLLKQLNKLPELDNLYRRLEDTKINLQARKTENDKAHALLHEQLKDAVPEEDVRADCLLMEATLQTHNRRIGELTGIIKQQEAVSEQQASYLNEKDVLAEKERISAMLDKLIGSADGKKFSAFAQGLTLDRLLIVANTHLQSLTNRYTLSRQSNNEKLDIIVRDSFFVHSQRPVQTLSGGETFIVSLALALGLADMMTGPQGISTMFIDEGFGSLDQSSLDLAVSMLEQLRNSGKTIGIISHVSELRQRINTQVVVEKTGLQGHSRLRITG
jgi:exonuclease SbcC